MDLREFFARHRLAAAIAAPVVLGVAAVAAATFTVTTSPSPTEARLISSVTECHDMVTISVAGRGDTPREGTTKMLVDANGNPLPAALSGDHSSEWVDPVVNAPDGEVAPEAYAAVYIAYPADMATYEDAVNKGAANTRQVMSEISAACPDTRFSIVGYSEGADVVRRVAQDIGHAEPNPDGSYAVVHPDQVVGVVILADAGRSAGDGPFPGAENPHRNPDGFDQAYQDGREPVPGQGALPGTSGDFGALNGKVASFCSDGDLTCSAPENISLLQLAVNVGRQVNVDALEREGLTPATGGDVAAAMGQITMAAFADIAAQPNWMASEETFLEVLLRVSDPEYQPGTPPAAAEPAAEEISSDDMSPLAYLPQKVFNEIVGLIVTNQNTIPVIMSDPYQQTLGPNATGHHFDYWRDADPNGGKPLTSAEYASAWLTHLAKQAQAGEPLQAKAKPEEADFAAVAAAATEQEQREKRSAELAAATPNTTSSSTATAPSTTTAPASESSTTSTAPTTTKSTESAAPVGQETSVTTEPTAPPSTTTPTPTTPTTTPAPSSTTTATPAPSTTTASTTREESSTTTPMSTTTPTEPTTTTTAAPAE